MKFEVKLPLRTGSLCWVFVLYLVGSARSLLSFLFSTTWYPANRSCKWHLTISNTLISTCQSKIYSLPQSEKKKEKKVSKKISQMHINYCIFGSFTYHPIPICRLESLSSSNIVLFSSSFFCRSKWRYSSVLTSTHIRPSYFLLLWLSPQPTI